MSDAGESYDAFPYPSFPFSITHPDRLHVLGALLGLEPGPIERCRVLELGCASGGNLVPIAVDLPAARCVGIDASPRQIEAGRAQVAALGLDNCELRTGDIAALGPELGTFDYIVCHGVYSWVPRPVQDAILAVCRRLLAPEGVAYVSYNTYPGWRMRGMIRDMMRYHARQFPDPKVAVEQSRKLLDYLTKNVPADRGPYGAFLQQELAVLNKQGDAYLFHEHLEANNEPLYFHELVERAQAAGLAYLGEASRGDTRATLYPSLADEEGRGSPAAIQAEQYRDFVTNRTFRTSLLCHAERRLRARPTPEAVPRFLAAARVTKRPADAPEAQVPEGTPPGTDYSTSGGAVRVHAPAVIAALDLLDARWPRAVTWDELLTVARAAAPEGLDETLLAEQVLQMFADDHLELRPRQPNVAAAVSARPRAHPLARLQAEQGESVTNARHDSHELDRFERELVRACDGARDLPALAEAMVAAVAAGRVEVTKDGAPLKDPVELREIFDKVLPGKLRHLLRRSLLVD